jgi:hypothetical protein
MANEAVWQSGWDMGAGKKKKTSDSDMGPSKSSGKARSTKGGGSAGGSSGGGNPWSILNVIKKSVGSFKNGGRVKRTGLALLHKGEHVVPAKHAKSRKRTSHKRTT